MLKVKHLVPTNQNFKSIINGRMWGLNQGLFASMPVRLRDCRCPTKIDVIFKVDTGAGITTLAN